MSRTSISTTRGRRCLLLKVIQVVQVVIVVGTVVIVGAAVVEGTSGTYGGGLSAPRATSIVAAASAGRGGEGIFSVGGIIVDIHVVVLGNVVVSAVASTGRGHGLSAVSLIDSIRVDSTR